jgi:hypothetical protein
MRFYAPSIVLVLTAAATAVFGWSVWLTVGSTTLLAAGLATHGHALRKMLR